MKIRKVLILTMGVAMLSGVALSQRNNAPEARLRAAMDKETVDGDLKGAVEGYKQVINQRGATREVMARALLRLGLVYEKQGDAEARKSYERLVREFADQPDVVQQARTRMSAAAAPTGLGLRRLCSGDDCTNYPVPGVRPAMSVQNNALIVRDATTGTSRQVANTLPGRRICCSYVSPDGKRIAYTIAPAGGGLDANSEIVVAKIDGGDPRTVYRGASLKAWSSDNQRILVTQSGRPTVKISWVTVDTGAVQTLPTALGNNNDIFRPSPDGRYLAFSGNNGEESENVYVMTVDGSELTRISPNSSYQEPIAWSSDSRQLVYHQGGSSMILWAVPIADGKAQGLAVFLKEFERQDGFLGLTPSGTLYYRTFIGAVNRTEIWAMDNLFPSSK